jgi:DNA-binding PadR family transcriptional regulator
MQNRSHRGDRAADAHLPLRPVACAVLAALADEARPGIDILEAVNATVPGRPLLGPGTLYRLLRELRQAGLIARTESAGAVADERQVHHELTPLGRSVLRADLDRLRRTIALAGGVRPATGR